MTELPDGPHDNGEAAELPDGPHDNGEAAELPDGPHDNGDAAELPDGPHDNGEAAVLPDGPQSEGAHSFSTYRDPSGRISGAVSVLDRPSSISVRGLPMLSEKGTGVSASAPDNSHRRRSGAPKMRRIVLPFIGFTSWYCHEHCQGLTGL